MENRKPGNGMVIALALLMFIVTGLTVQASDLDKSVSTAVGGRMLALADGSTIGSNLLLQQKLDMLKTLIQQLQSLLAKLNSLQTGTNQSSSSSNPKVSTPNGGEKWSRSNSETISWSGSSPVDIYLSEYFPCFDATPKCSPPVREDQLVASGISGGSYFWTISDSGFQDPGSGDHTYKIKVTDKSGRRDESDSYFTIGDMVKTSSTRVTAPVGQGQQLVRGSEYKIKWQSAPGPVDIYLAFSPDFPCTAEICPMGYKKEIKIASSAVGDDYTWKISDEGLVTQAGNDTYVIKITPAGDKTIYSLSGTFYITAGN